MTGALARTAVRVRRADSLDAIKKLLRDKILMGALIADAAKLDDGDAIGLFKIVSSDVMLTRDSGRLGVGRERRPRL